jgi:hypothetical protein
MIPCISLFWVMDVEVEDEIFCCQVTIYLHGNFLSFLPLWCVIESAWFFHDAIWNWILRELDIRLWDKGTGRVPPIGDFFIIDERSLRLLRLFIPFLKIFLGQSGGAWSLSILLEHDVTTSIKVELLRNIWLVRKAGGRQSHHCKSWNSLPRARSLDFWYSMQPTMLSFSSPYSEFSLNFRDWIKILTANYLLTTIHKLNPVQHDQREVYGLVSGNKALSV